MRTCLFNNVALDATTKEEHTIQRSLGGRIKSFDVSSSDFNELCGKRVDPALAAVYSEVMITLGPTLPTEARTGSLYLSIDGQEGTWQVNDQGQLVLVNVIVERNPETGLPKFAVAANVEALGPLIKQLAKKGVKVVRIQEELPSDTKVWYPERAVLDWRVDIALMKSLLLTFDERLKNDSNRFTRSATLDPVREFVREMVESGGVTPNKQSLADYTLGLQYESEYVDRYAELRNKANLPDKPFQHTLIISGHAPCRTLDAVFWAFGTDPHAFRLATNWTGGDFTYVLTNGILLNEAPSDAVLLPGGYTLGRPNERRCYRVVRGPIPTAAELSAIGDEIMERRLQLCRKAVNYVERYCDMYVQGQFSRLARLNPNNDNRLTTAIYSHLAVLFGGMTSTDSDADEFLKIIIPILDPVENDVLPANVSEDATPPQGWPYWLSKYRQCLDALQTRFGIPGHFFRGQRRFEFQGTPV